MLQKTACVFTGHRQLEYDFDQGRLQQAIENFIQQGVQTFYCGMALGFDLLAAELVLAFKKTYKDVKFIACIPCYNQEKSFPEKDK